MRDRHLGAACDDYLARARRHLPVEVVEVEDDAALLRRMPAAGVGVGGEIVALEPGGDGWDTARFTKYLEDGMLHGRRAVTFLIGGSDGLPAAAVGYHEVFPGVWQSWMVGTMDGWARNWRSITKGTRFLMDHLLDRCGARRLQLNALASRTAAIDWYVNGLKMRYDGRMPCYGIHGEDVVMYSRTIEPDED